MFIKNSFWVVVLVFYTLLWSGDWVFKYKNTTWFEEDFYNYFPLSDWVSVGFDLQKRDDIVSGFIKQQVSVWEALNLGLLNVLDSLEIKPRYLL